MRIIIFLIMEVWFNMIDEKVMQQIISCNMGKIIIRDEAEIIARFINSHSEANSSAEINIDMILLRLTGLHMSILESSGENRMYYREEIYDYLDGFLNAIASTITTNKMLSKQVSNVEIVVDSSDRHKALLIWGDNSYAEESYAEENGDNKTLQEITDELMEWMDKWKL